MTPHLSCLLPSQRLSPELACSASIMNWFSLPLKLSLQAMTDCADSAAMGTPACSTQSSDTISLKTRRWEAAQSVRRHLFGNTHENIISRAPRWLLGTQYFPSSNLRGPIIWGLLSAPSQSVLTAHKVMVSRKNLYFDKTFGEKRRYSESTSNIQLMENLMNFILYFA